MTPYETYRIAEQRINEGLIRKYVSVPDMTDTRTRGKDRMKTMESFLRHCGNPQNGIPAIHVTGTSGKGSVCALISEILRQMGFRVGRHTSPYLQSATEKIWINNQYIRATQFADLVDWVLPKCHPFLRPETPASIHGMASVAIALEAFRLEQVDVIVMEAGCGGRYDLTSFVDTRVGVVTNVAEDHLASLGPTTRDIAWHKAGIARPSSVLINGARTEFADIFQQEAESVQCDLIEIPRKTETARQHNERIAKTAAAAFLHHMGRSCTPDTISIPSGVRLPGRFETLQSDSPTILLDGAHNHEKLATAVQYALSEDRYPRIALVGCMESHATCHTLSPLSKDFSGIVVTEPRVFGKKTTPAADLASLLSRTCDCPLEVIPNPSAALKRSLEIAARGMLLITGSFYLCGELREHWYSKEQVVCQRSSWPC
jgi:dihydrofolate synthase / folylpolyglutamate synthase